MSSNVRPISLSECADAILEVGSAAIVTHIRPDADTVGTAVALCRLLTALGKDAALLPSDTIPERLAFLTEGVKTVTSADGRDVIACDVASAAQLGELYAGLPEVYLTIDHHAVNAPFSRHYTVPTASSAAEVLFEITAELSSRGKLVLTPELAYPLYAAISSDTGGFVFSSASPTTYRVAAALIETGIDFADINHRLFQSKSREQLRAEGFIAEATVSSGSIAYAVITKADRERLGIGNEHFETAIDIVRSLEGTEIAFTLKELDEGKYRVSLRSTGFNVADVAAKFSGGGHIRAAGCTIVAPSPTAAAETIISAINERKQES